MFRIYFFSLLFLNVVFLNSAFASATVVNDVVEKALVLGLDKHPYWLRLLHYKSEYQNAELKVSSEIITAEFFLSSDGAVNSKSELVATIRALYEEPGVDQDQHAQCRFVARFKWLAQMLNWGDRSPPVVSCGRFNEYSLNGNIESLSLIFATGYLGNPASYYGHILLKFNADRQFSTSDFLDQSINYGAIIPENEGGLIYIIKGLLGGYEAGFSSQKFYRHNHIYVENELRDMWEYELALTKDEIDQVVAHSWELLKNEFDYFFLKENCAYRMAELLGLVVDRPLISSNLPWALPSTVFENLVSHQGEEKELVTQVRRIPSRQNLFYEKYSLLSDKQRHAVSSLVADNYADFSKSDYSVLSSLERIEVIDVLFDYYAFRMALEKDNKEMKAARQKLIIERLKYAGSNNLNVLNTQDELPPHKGPLPFMVSMSLLSNSSYGEGVGLQVRPVYFDMLSLEAGRLPNSNLTMFDLDAIYLDDQLFVRRLDFVNVESLNVSRTGLPGDGGMAWKIKFGIENQHLGCVTCSVFNIVGGYGKAASLIENKAIIYGMLEFNAQTEYEGSGSVAGTALLGIYSAPFNNWKSRLQVGRKVYLNGQESEVDLVHWENRFGNSRDWDIRVDYEKNVAKEIRLSVSLYW